MLDDPWGTLAMAGVIALGVGLMATGVGGPIGAGILIGAASTAVMGVATDNFNPRSVAIGGAFGAIPGGHTVGGAFAAGVGESLTSQVLIDGRGITDISLTEAVIGGTIGAVIPAAGPRLRNLLPNGTADDLIPGGATRGMEMDDFVQNHGDSWGTPGSVSPGGHVDGDRVLAGHGGIPTGTGSAQIWQVPEGTSIATYGPHGDTILDSWGKQAELGSATPSHLYEAGDIMPDYTLFPVDPGINHLSMSDVVKVPTRVSELVGSGEGVEHWAACLEELSWLNP